MVEIDEGGGEGAGTTVGLVERDLGGTEEPVAGDGDVSAGVLAEEGEVGGAVGVEVALDDRVELGVERELEV